MQHFILILILAAGSFLLAGDEIQADKELAALQGEWKTVGMEAGGKPLPKEQVLAFTFVIGADGKSVGKTGNSEFECLITVDPKKTPRTMDNAHKTGFEKGKTQLGIYKLAYNKLTVCMARAGAPETDRPKDFNTKDTTNVVFVFERAKAVQQP